MRLRRAFRVRSLILLTAAAYIVTAAFGVSVIFAPAPASAAQSIPYKVNFQGRLTDNSGNALSDGLYNMRFRLFTAPTAGTNQWQADRVRGAADNRVQVTNGLFNIQFGDTALGDPALTPSLFNTGTGTLYLEVELPTPATATCATNGCAVFTEGAMTPRQPLASSPYAFNSDTLDGLDSSAFGQLAASNTFTGANTFTPSSGVGITVQAASGTNSVAVKDAAGVTQAFFDSAGILNVAQTIQATAGTVDLGTSGTGFRTGYFSTSVQTPALNATTIGGTITTNLGTLQRTASGTTTIDLVDAGNTTLAVTNSGGGVAGISASGGLTIGSGRVITVGAAAGAGVTCSSGQVLDAVVVTGGVVTGGTCIAAGGGDRLLSTWTSQQATTATNTQTTVQFTGAANSAPSFNDTTHVLTLPSNASKLAIVTKAGGGGGGSVGTTNAVKAAGGGGEGAQSTLFIGGSLAANYYFKVGAGGAGGAAGATNNGAAGSPTCLGTNVTDACTSPAASAVGGSGGTGVTNAVTGAGGAGGAAAAGVGDVKISGAPGANSTAIATTAIQSGGGGGQGGGVGRAGAAASGDGNPGASGGGGSGAQQGTAAVTSRAGGAGGAGYLKIDVYVTTTGAGSPATLQTAYDNSTDPEIVLGSSGLSVRDNPTPVSGNLFEVQDTTGATNYLAVTSTGISTSGSIAATGGITASTTGTINGLNIGSGALSGVTGYTQNSGTFNQTFASATGGASGQVLGFSNTNTGAGVSVQGSTFTPTNTATPSSGANTLSLINFAAGTSSGTNITNGINFTSSTGYTNFINSPTFDLNSAGDVTSGFTQLNGTSTTTNAAASTSLPLASAANFDIGNYVQVNSANCGGAGVNPCYAKITNKVVNTLTITPALNWANGSTVNEFHVPEIGATNTANTLANRFGRGYFIAGVAAGNGTTFYNEDSIESTLTTFELLAANVTTLNLGTAATSLSLGGSGTTVTIPGSLSVTGNITAPATGTSGYLSRSGTTLTPSNAGDTLSTSGDILTTGTGTITAAGGVNIAAGQTYKINGTQISSTSLSNDAAITKQGNTFNGVSQLVQTTGTGALPALNAGALTNLTSGNLTGALPALNGSALTNLTAANLTGTLPTLSGANLTNLNPTNLATGSGAVALQSAAAAAITITANAASTWSTTAGNLTLNSGGGTLVLGAATTTLQKSATAFTVDLNNAAASTLAVTNAGAGVASLSVEGNVSIGAGQTYQVNGTQISSADLSNDAAITKQGNTFNGNSQLVQTTAGGAYPALNGAAITNLTSGNLVGALPAVSGASLTNLNPSNLATGSGAVTLQSAAATALTLTSNAAATWSTTAGNLTLNAAGGTLIFGAATTTLQKSATGLTIDVNNAAASTLTVTNAGAGVASLAVEGGVSIGAGQTYQVNGTQISSANLSNDAAITKQGNTFNGASQLIQTTAGGAYPALSGTNITAINASNIAQGSGAVTLQSAAATAMTFTANAASIWSTTAGQLTVQSGSGTLSFGTTTALTSTGALNIDSGTVNALNIGTGANAKTVTVGNTTGATALNLNSGTGGINLGDTANTKTIDIGGVTNSGTDTVNIATNGTLPDALNIGNNTSGTRVIINGGPSTTTSGTNGVIIGSATADATQVNLQLDSSSTFTETASTCSATVNQGAMYYNTAANVMRACVNGAWEDLVSTAGLGLQLFGVVPDSGLNPGDLAAVTGNQNGPCKVSVGAALTTVSWTACTAYSGGRKVLVTAGTATTTNGVAGNYQHLCLTGTNSQPALSASGAITANLATVSMPSVNSPILCLADIRFNAANNTITQIYDARTYTITDKVPVTVSTTAPALGHLVQFTATKGVVSPMATLNGNNLAGVLVASTGATSTTTVNGIMAIGGPAAVKAITGTNLVGAYIFGSATAGFASTVATKPVEGTGTIYNLIGNARTAWTGAAACAVNNDTCAGSILTFIDKR